MEKMVMLYKGWADSHWFPDADLIRSWFEQHMLCFEISIHCNYASIFPATIISRICQGYKIITHCTRSNSPAGGILTPSWGHVRQKRTSSPGPGSDDPAWNPCHLRSFSSLHALDTLRSSLYLFCHGNISTAVVNGLLHLLAQNAGMHWMSLSAAYYCSSSRWCHIPHYPK